MRSNTGNIQINWEEDPGFILQTSPSVVGIWTAVDAIKIQVDADQIASFSTPATEDTQFFRLIESQ